MLEEGDGSVYSSHQIDMSERRKVGVRTQCSGVLHAVGSLYEY